jgi:hypothetical protein
MVVDTDCTTERSTGVARVIIQCRRGKNSAVMMYAACAHGLRVA